MIEEFGLESDLEKSALRSKVARQDKTIKDLNKTIDKLSESETDGHIEFNALKYERDELFNALSDLVNGYVANKGDPNGEFIKCVTPESASSITPLQRMRSKYWRMWDRARLALGEGKDGN